MEPEVTDIYPTDVCIGVTEEVRLTGKGLSLAFEEAGALCTYQFSENTFCKNINLLINPLLPVVSKSYLVSP